MRPLLFTFFLLVACISLHGQGQTRTTKRIAKNYYLNGDLKSVSETSTTLPRFIDPANYYKKTKIYVLEYDSVTHQQKREWTRIYKIGKDGKPCHELFYEEITYDQFGKRLTYLRTRCDKQKSKFIQYKDGEVDFIQVVKNRKRR